MGDIVELPLLEPMYSTYHNQGAATAVIANNPSVRIWNLNEIMNLTCSRKFLKGFTTPELTIPGASFQYNPSLENEWFFSKYLKGYINMIIRQLIDKGLYVAFDGVDDYYIEGKSWYKKRHFLHDGLICGYNLKEKTYCIYAYDSNWVYKKFWISQESFNKARVSAAKQGKMMFICGIKPKDEIFKLSPSRIKNNLEDYLNSDLEKYPFEGDGNVYGIVIHEYLAKYISKLIDGSIPYERMDWRIFRTVWEHKKVMLERIRAVENELGIDKTLGDEYEKLVSEADNIRMLFASHNMRRRDSVLPIIKKKLLQMSKAERSILTYVILDIEKRYKENAMEAIEKKNEEIFKANDM